MMLKSKLGAAVTGILIVGASVFGSAAPAMAAQGTVGGTVNCNGLNVYYSTVRYVSANSTRVQYKLTNATGSTYGILGTGLGMRLTSTGEYLGQKWMTTQAPNVLLSPYYYLAGTSFTLYAHMEASDGACDNVFSGILYY